MNAKDLALIPDVKGTKNGQDSASQFEASVKMENAAQGTTKKVVYLQPKSDGKIDDFFKFEKQARSRQHDINLLAIAICGKYGNEFGPDFAHELFADCREFSSNFTMDIVTKVDDDDTTAKDISYIQAGNTIARYLVAVDDPSVCSVFRHFMDYAKATGRASVALLQEKEIKEREAVRKEKAVSKKIQEMDVTKLLSMLTPEQLAAIAAAQAAQVAQAAK